MSCASSTGWRAPSTASFRIKSPSNSKPPFDAVGIAGTGLIGASLGLRLREAGVPEIVGFDPSRAHLDRAADIGAIDAAVESVDALLHRCDAVVLCGPVDAVVATLAALDRAAPRRARLLCDAGSVKRPVVAAAAGIAEFVGSHPMAGSHESGPSAAHADLFEGRRWIMVPAADARANELMRALIVAAGAIAIELDAAEHDRLVARTSHLPQLLSTLLAVRALRAPTHGAYGKGLEDMLRLAASPASIWRDILLANRDAVVEELDAFANRLRRVGDALTHANGGEIERVFAEANRLVEAFARDPGKDER